MATSASPVGGAAARVEETVQNGAAMAAFLAAGIGTFVLGLVVILNEAGVYTAPTLYEPSGGVTGRTAIGTVVWLIAWAALHALWKRRSVEPGRVLALTLALLLLGLVLMFPPVWSLVS